MPGVARHSVLLAAALALAAAPGVPVAAQEASVEADRDESARALEQINRGIEESREAEVAVAAEIAELESDRAGLNEELIDTAAAIKDSETSIAVLEGRIAALADREATLRDSLRGRSGVLTELLAALQRMGRQPPPAVLVSPEDALKTVRTAMLLGAIMPGVRIETEALASDLEELVRLKRDIGAERSRLIARTRELDGQRTRITALIEARQRQQRTSEGRLGEIRDRAAELAAEAQDLRDLIASMDRELAIAEQEAARAPTSAQAALDALRDPGRLQPAIAFADARGLLPMPASGAVIRGFGAADEIGAPSRGLSLSTRSQAQVTSPSDGWVVYSGPFRSYGQLLILNAGDGYHVLLAGMERIEVELGQFVLAGEPVGTMGGLVVASAENVTVGRLQPVLYVEFRKDGQSIDPAPWWADGRTGVGG